MSTVLQTSSRRAFNFVAVQVAVLMAVILIVLGVYYRAAINDVVVSILTLGGNFWLTAALASIAGSYTIAWTILNGNSFTRHTGLLFAFIVCASFTRGAWLAELHFTELQVWTFCALCFLMVYSGFLYAVIHLTNMFNK